MVRKPKTPVELAVDRANALRKRALRLEASMCKEEDELGLPHDGSWDDRLKRIGERRMKA